MSSASKVYVGNLGNHASRTELEGAFGKFGRLANVWVARNPPGFAFVEFEDPRDAEDAVRQMDGARVCGVRIRAEMSRGRRREVYHHNRRGHYKSRSRSPVRRRSRSITRSRSRSVSRTRNHRSRSESRDRNSYVLQRINGKEDFIKDK